MDLAEELRASLQELLASGNLEIRETGSRVTAMEPVSWEIRGAAEKPLLHLWAENCNLTRRVLAINDHSAGRIALSVERFGRSQPQKLDLVRVEFQRSAKEISREGFCDALRRILAEQFPDETVEKLSIAADLEHSLSRIYARGISRKGAVRCAFLAVPQGETPDAIESSLTYALLWLERARQFGKRMVSFLRLILPAGTAESLVHRLGALHPRLAIQVYELNSLDEQIRRVDPCSNGNVKAWLMPRREGELLKSRSSEALAPIVSLMPEAISLHAIEQEQEVVLRFRGLTFARWQEGRVYFGIGAAMEELLPSNEDKLKRLVRQLQDFRNPLASDTRHPLYRAQPERWMQSLITEDLSHVDIDLDTEHVYEQVFARAGGRHGIPDLLTVTRAKRLAILELKATENPDLPLQAADYWMRIRRHQVQGDLARYGYFPGMELQASPPVVYLVAPALRFHPTTEIILSYLSPEIEVVRIGVAENWRRGLRVMLRKQAAGSSA
jgi:hypothetical protein